jgi:hypothetical protein
MAPVTYDKPRLQVNAVFFVFGQRAVFLKRKDI